MHRTICTVLGIVCVFFGLLLRAAEPWTLEDILSIPFPSQLVAASQADRIAWVMNIEGRRNVWTAAPPDFRPVRLTHFTSDDGQPIEDLRITSDGRYVVFVRGGAPNRAGEHPNPTSNPEGAKQVIIAVSTDGRQRWTLAEGHDPVLSPDNRWILFVRKGQIFRIALKRNAQPEQLFRARGRNGNPVWSPDGTRIAFVSNRQDHAFIGVYDLRQRTIRWMAPSVDRDMHPVWSPDGRRLAWIRLPGRKKHERLHLMTGYPFAILVGDVTTGESRTVWRSPGADGGFAQWYPAHPLRWTRTGKLLFYSEHEGWLHIYRLDPDTGDLTDLTPGRGIVENSSVDASGRWLVHDGNHGDLDRRHIWLVDLLTARRTPLTEGHGIETHPVFLASGKYIAYMAATARQPQGIFVLDRTTRQARRIAPESWPERFPMDQLVEPEVVRFRSVDGWTIHAQLFRPRHAGQTRRPAVIFLHGGPIRQMYPGWHDREYYARAYAMNQYLASRGYIVLSVNFRTGIGYGRAFRLAPRQGPRGASEYQDVRAAAMYLRSRPDVDPERIGLWGGSYGGYLTAMGLARDSDLFAAGADLHGVHDWAFRATDFYPGGGWGLESPEELEEAYRSSPVATLDAWFSPVLVIHGDDDRNVLFAQTTDLVQRLRERNVHVEVLVLPDEVHGFLLHRSWLRVYRAVADFFDRCLRRTCVPRPGTPVTESP